MFKPLSLVQRKVLCLQAERFGLGSTDLGLTVKAKRSIHVKVDHCQPFILGLTDRGQLGIVVEPMQAFEPLPAKTLTDNQFAEIVNNGFVFKTFRSNHRELAFAFSYLIGNGYGLGAQLAVDAIDLSASKTIGTFGVQIDLTKGLVEDHRIIQPILSGKAQRRLCVHHYDPSNIGDARQWLTHEGEGWDGFRWVNLRVEHEYCNKGREGFYGIAQIMVTTALRLAAEQFFSVAYLLGTGPFQASYFERVFGAKRLKYCSDKGSEMMAYSFIGQPGFDYVESILRQRQLES